MTQMKKIKILGIFGNVANAGQERANSDVYNLLSNENKYNVLVLVNDRGFQWHLQPFFEKNSIPFKKIRFPWGIYSYSSIRDIFQWMSDIVLNNIQFIYNYVRFRPDYIHIGNEYMFKTLILPLSLCNAKIIFRLGDRPYIRRFYNRWFWKLIAKRVNTFVCDTYFIHNLLKEAGRNNPHDIVLYHPAPERISHSNGIQYSVNKDIITFGYVGQIKESKGVGLVVKCAYKLCRENPNIEFVFAGNIENNSYFQQSIKPILDEMPQEIKSRICFLGHIEDIDSFYSAIDVHVAPTLAEEPYGLVLIEAKKNHKPSIIMPSGGMLELVQHLQNGFICNSKDETGLTESIKYYLTHSDCIAEHGEDAFKSIDLLGITYDNFREQWISIYH